MIIQANMESRYNKWVPLWKYKKQILECNHVIWFPTSRFLWIL